MSIMYKNTQKGFVVPLVVAIVALLIAGGAYYMVKYPKGWVGNNTSPATSTENTNSNPPVVGGDRDAHGCLPSAGYSWSETKKACVRPWEESATTSMSDWKTYTNDEYAFTFRYPSDVVSNDNSMQVQTSDYYSVQFRINSSSLLRVLAQNTTAKTLDEYLKQSDQTSQTADEGQPSKRILSTKDLTIDGMPAIQREEFANAAGFKIIQTYVKSGNTLYSFGIFPNSSTGIIPEKDMQVYAQILTTIKLPSVSYNSSNPKPIRATIISPLPINPA